MLQLIFCLTYCVVGAIIAAPYTWLANGDARNFAIAVLLGPLTITSLLGLWHTGLRKRRWLFWSALAYFCLPIIFNWLATVLYLGSFVMMSEVIYAIRYPSLLFVAGSLGLSLVFYAAMIELRQKYPSRQPKRRRARATVFFSPPL